MALLSDVIRAKEPPRNELLRSLHKWSALAGKYGNTSGEMLSDAMKMAVSQNMHPK